MLSIRLVNDFHWEFKLVLSYSKPHTFSTFVGEEKEKTMHLLGMGRYSPYRYNIDTENNR